MKIDDSPKAMVTSIPIEQHQVGMPLMATPLEEVAKATTDIIFSAMPTLQILLAFENQ